MLDDVIKREPTTVARKMPEWVPVIFANGEDDDTPGLIACFANEKVQYGERVYRPDEDMVITGVSMVITKGIRLLSGEGSMTIAPGAAEIIDISLSEGFRKVEISHCSIRWAAP